MNHSDLCANLFPPKLNPIKLTSWYIFTIPKIQLPSFNPLYSKWYSYFVVVSSPTFLSFEFFLIFLYCLLHHIRDVSLVIFLYCQFGNIQECIIIWVQPVFDDSYFLRWEPFYWFVSYCIGIDTWRHIFVNFLI